jgi:DAK2 domain fusion protein YloV
MSYKQINGILLEQMLRNGLANLRMQEDEINRLNVFPVPDGDTGTNMVKTLEHGLEHASSNTEVGFYTKFLSEGMLLGARGNSGVILSQFFSGLAQSLSRESLIGPGELRSALVKGYREAYSAVIRPVEGTILTVAREGIENIRAQITRSTPVDAILQAYVAEMRKALSMTPEQLSVLKEAGVVDSGAAGFILIFEGMVKFLQGEIIDDHAALHSESLLQKGPDLSLFDENSSFTDGYCMEFILQLMNSPKYKQNFKQKSYIDALQMLGNSIVCVQDRKRVKVHIHTLTPSIIIDLSQKYGEFLTFKLENMQVQHNERDIKVAVREHKQLSVVAVVNGAGMRSLFKGLGADHVIDGGPTMNTSSQEFVDAFNSLDADAIVVLPNNKNVILAAEQAAALVPGKNVTVLPTASFVEGYFAIAMDIPDEADVDRRIHQMRSGIGGVNTVSEATASRAYSSRGISCEEGEEIAFLNGELACSGSDWKDAVTEAIGMIEDIDDRETMIALRGAGVPAEYEDELREELSERYPMLETSFVDAGQEIYHWVIGIM